MDLVRRISIASRISALSHFYNTWTSVGTLPTYPKPLPARDNNNAPSQQVQLILLFDFRARINLFHNVAGAAGIHIVAASSIDGTRLLTLHYLYCVLDL